MENLFKKISYLFWVITGLSTGLISGAKSKPKPIQAAQPVNRNQKPIKQEDRIVPYKKEDRIVPYKNNDAYDMNNAIKIILIYFLNAMKNSLSDVTYENKSPNDLYLTLKVKTTSETKLLLLMNDKLKVNVDVESQNPSEVLYEINIKPNEYIISISQDTLTTKLKKMGQVISSPQIQENIKKFIISILETLIDGPITYAKITGKQVIQFFTEKNIAPVWQNIGQTFLATLFNKTLKMSNQNIIHLYLEQNLKGAELDKFRKELDDLANSKAVAVSKVKEAQPYYIYLKHMAILMLKNNKVKTAMENILTSFYGILITVEEGQNAEDVNQKIYEILSDSFIDKIIEEKTTERLNLLNNKQGYPMQSNAVAKQDKQLEFQRNQVKQQIIQELLMGDLDLISKGLANNENPMKNDIVLLNSSILSDKFFEVINTDNNKDTTSQYKTFIFDKHPISGINQKCIVLVASSNSLHNYDFFLKKDKLAPFVFKKSDIKAEDLQKLLMNIMKASSPNTARFVIFPELGLNKDSCQLYITDTKNNKTASFLKEETYTQGLAWLQKQPLTQEILQITQGGDNKDPKKALPEKSSDNFNPL